MIQRVAAGVVCPVVLFLLVSGSAFAASALGPRIGTTDGGDDLFLGAQGEFGPVVDAATFVPGIDFGLGDGVPTTADFALRYYLIRLPETGLRFYGGAGAAVVLEDDTELGLSLTLGLNIPMKESRRYNLEYRWGLGDIPDHRIGFGVMFGL